MYKQNGNTHPQDTRSEEKWSIQKLTKNVSKHQLLGLLNQRHSGYKLLFYTDIKL